MIEEILSNPSSRVFSVDRDCYVVFTGKDENAKSAFLRVGYSEKLPSLVHRYIEGVVCAPYLLGDVVSEKELLNSMGQRARPYFSGTPAVLKRYYDFFALKKAFATKYQQVKSFVQEDSGAFIYYTDSDQIEVVLNSKCLLSLRKRAAADLHFTQRNQRIARLISQYSNAYTAATLPSNGFFVVDSALYLCDSGNIFAVNPPANCYARLAECGFDSRIISGGLHLKPDYSFLSLIMNESLKVPLRKWYLYPSNKQLSGLIDATPFLRFAQKNISIRTINDSTEIPFSAFNLLLGADYQETVSQQTETVPQQSNGESGLSSYSLHLSDRSQFVIDVKNCIWRVVDGDAVHEGELISNIPYSFSFTQPVPYTTLARRYLPDVFQTGAHQFARNEIFILNSFIRFFHIQTAHKLKTAYEQIKRACKAMRQPVQLLTIYALKNISVLLRMKCDECQDDHIQLPWLKKALEQAQSILAYLSPLNASVLCLSAQAIIHLTTSGDYVQFVQYTWSKSSRQTAHDFDIRQRISNIIAGAGEDFYKAERIRLCRALVDLHSGNEEVRALIKDELEREKRQKEEEIRQEKQMIARKQKVQKRALSGRMVRVIAFFIIAAALIVLAVVLIAQNRQGATETRDTIESTTAQDAASTVGELSSLNDIKAQIENSSLAESEFTVIINPNAVFISDVYLTVQGPLWTVEVTIGEIIRVVNIIARQNGFHEISAEDVTVGNDPDLIYPFDQLILPPYNTAYSIVEDDSIWLVAVSLIENQIKDFVSQLVQINNIIRSGSLSVDARAYLHDTLDVIINDAYSMSLVDIASDMKRRL